MIVKIAKNMVYKKMIKMNLINKYKKKVTKKELLSFNQYVKILPSLTKIMYLENVNSLVYYKL